MKSNFLRSIGAMAVAAGLLASQSCSSDDGFGNNLGNIVWTDGGVVFNGAFGWDEGGVAQTALFSGTTCDDLDTSVDIATGLSQDPCALETNEDGTPFDGTIDGTVCNSDNDTATAHTVTCVNGAISDTSQDVNPAAADIVMYRSEGQTGGGNLGGRTGADAICVADKPGTVTQTNVRAFLSVTDSDEIRDMPDNYDVPSDIPIVGTNGVQIGADWADLLDGTIDATLNDAGVSTDDNWAFGGSNSDGSLNENNCDGWTSTASIYANMILDDTTTDWIGGGEDNPCGSYINFILCVAY